MSPKFHEKSFNFSTHKRHHREGPSSRTGKHHKNIQRYLNDVCVCRQPKLEFNWKCLSLNRFLVVITIVSIVYENRVTRVESSEAVSNCTGRKTCTRCIGTGDASSCGWSVSKQKCVDGRPPNTISNRRSCPTFLVERNKTANAVTVTNDGTGFVNTNSLVACRIDDVDHTALVQSGNRILCGAPETVRQESSDPLKISFLSVTVDGVPLRFDNMANHYMVPEKPCNVSGLACTDCQWVDENYMARCTWCPPGGPCQGDPPFKRCNVRRLSDFKCVKGDNVRIGGGCARIDRFEPEYGAVVGETTVRIRVHDHWLLSGGANWPYTVNVAGRKCTIGSKNATTSADNTIVCTVNGTHGTTVNDSGPVEVIYNGWPPLIVQSNITFRFVEPAITAVWPICGNDTRWSEKSMGNETDAVAFVVDGEFLDVGLEVRASFVPNNVTCAIKTRNRNQLKCVTAGLGPIFSRLRLVLDGGRHVDGVPVSGPMVLPNQTFGGPAFGGTAFWVRGRGFSCLHRARAVLGTNETTVPCHVRSDTHLECRSPAVNAVRSLRVGFRAELAGESVRFGPSDVDSDYRLYPNPVFVDFAVEGCCDVTIYHTSGDGYRTDEYAVRLLPGDVGCSVTEVHPDRIACRLPSSPVQSEPRSISVSVGHNFTANVTREKSVHVNSSLQTSVILPSVVAIAAYVSFIAFLAVALVCLKTPKRYDLLPLHRDQTAVNMRPLDERQPNDYDEDDDAAAAFTAATAAGAFAMAALDYGSDEDKKSVGDEVQRDFDLS